MRGRLSRAPWVSLVALVASCSDSEEPGAGSAPASPAATEAAADAVAFLVVLVEVAIAIERVDVRRDGLVEEVGFGDTDGVDLDLVTREEFEVECLAGTSERTAAE